MPTDLASVTAALTRMDRDPLEAVAFAATQQHIRSCELVRSSDHQDDHPRQVEYADEATSVSGSGYSGSLSSPSMSHRSPWRPKYCERPSKESIDARVETATH